VQNQAQLSELLACETTRRLHVEYSAPVRDCRRELRVFPPPSRGGQHVLELHWQCDPPPTEIQESDDDFGNEVLHLSHRHIAHEFRFEMTLVTQHESTPIASATNLPPSGLGAFLLPSALCDLTPEIEEVAKGFRSRAHSRAPLQLAREVCEFAYRHIEYSPGATDPNTSASQSLQQQKGVCQDHAHLMIALCRALKIPARYVSGYLPGEGAMHAWVEVLVEDEWHGFDPTHNREARTDYVFVACGRDFRDCAPHQGSFRGRAHARLESHCKTRSL
jgi:transglutaminase-like putative cysteine protease